MYCRATQELLNGTQIMEIHPREPRCPTFCERLRVACTEALTVQLMNVPGLCDLDEQKVEDSLCLLIFKVLEVKDDLNRTDKKYR